MKKVYLFDIDGTLTPPRQVIDPDFARFFLQFALNNIVYLSTGSDRSKALQQVGPSIMNACRGVFTCCGNEFWEGNKKVYEREFYPGLRLENYLNDCVANTSFPIKAGRHLEYRKGMLNFSVVGRDATREERALYAKWDAEHREREKIANHLILASEHYGDIDVSIGGEISIDIYLVGRDKSQSVNTVRQLHALPIVYVGDKMSPNGNDYPAVKALKQDFGDLPLCVSSWQETRSALRRIMHDASSDVLERQDD